MSGSIFPVTGTTGSLQTRREIRDLAQDPYQYPLFIRALSNIQTPGYTYKGNDATSWHQMGGIHGEPYTNWSGDPNVSPNPINPTDDDQWSGYCHHQSILFPTWHRTVLLLVEQAICLEATAIAEQFAAACSPAEGQKWLNAAQQLRLPFWDWTAAETGIEGMPPLLMAPSISLVDPITPSGTPPLNNPLYTYNFDGSNSQWFQNSTTAPSWYQDWVQTYRWPTNTIPHTNAADQPDAMTNAFVNGGTISYTGDDGTVYTTTFYPYDWLVQQSVSLFQLPMAQDPPMDPKYYGNLWDIFSNTGQQNGEEPSSLAGYVGTSLENPHDMVHLLVGGYGHMSDADSSSFDPSFFLHHCNVDRMYAFWQYIYSEYWMDNGYTDENGKHQGFVDLNGNFDLQDNSSIDNTSSLTPFRTGATGNPYWTSEGVKDPLGLNYTYPPIVVTGDLLQITVDLTNVNPSYGNRLLYKQALQTYFKYHLSHADALKELPSFKPQFLLSGSTSNDLLNKCRHFTVIVRAKQWAYKRSHSIHLLIPAQQAASGLPAQQEVAIGAVSIFMRSNTSRCDNCVGRQAADVLSTGQIVLSPLVIMSLLQRNQLNQDSTTEQQIIDMLKRSFRCRIVSAGNDPLSEGRLTGDQPLGQTPTDATKIPELNLYSAAMVQPPTDSPNGGGPGHYGDWKDHGALDYSWTDVPA